MSENVKGKYTVNDDMTKKKNPTIAIILSVLFPGLGQIYTNQLPKGLIIIALNVVVNFLLIDPIEKILASQTSLPDKPALIIVSGYTIALLVLFVYAIIDAKKTADKINRVNEEDSSF